MNEMEIVNQKFIRLVDGISEIYVDVKKIISLTYTREHLSIKMIDGKSIIIEGEGAYDNYQKVLHNLDAKVY